MYLFTGQLKAEKRKAEIDTNDSVKKLRTDFNNASAVILKLMENENELKEKYNHIEEKMLSVTDLTEALNAKDERINSLTERNRRLQNTVRQKSDIINKITLNISKMNEYNIPMKGILKKKL